MHFPDVTHHTRARTKSVQINRVMAMSASRESLDDDDAFPPIRPSSVLATPVPGMRSSSLNVNEYENIPSIRRYKSMLDVDEAPTLPATKPMTYDELYEEHFSEPIPTSPATRPLDIAKYWKSSHTWLLILRLIVELLLEYFCFRIYELTFVLI
ncbi:MAG: hypothetical protein JWP34_4772 [Massilia sp.]|nr:hypothetical protein [Massilia sp.]